MRVVTIFVCPIDLRRPVGAGASPGGRRRHPGAGWIPPAARGGSAGGAAPIRGKMDPCLEAPLSSRRLLLVPVLAAVLGCGPSQLTRREAEDDLRKNYPVVVLVRLPETASASKGSPEHARLVTLQAALARTGWFVIERTADGDRERFRFQPKPQAPRTLRAATGGFELPAAEAEFVRVLPRLDSTRDGVRVSYLVRLVHPTEHFPLFQALHPGVKIGETKERHASYRRQGRSWVLAETDEFFKKAN